MATVIDIADAIVTDLNAGSFLFPFTAERWYVPIRDLKDLTNETQPTISVVPLTVAGTLLSRGGQFMEQYDVGIGIQKSIGGGQMTPAQIIAACDPLMTFCEQLMNFFAAKALLSYPSAVCTQHKLEPIYSPQHLDERRVFTSVLTLTFKRGK
jgi:hypothetical protein